MLEWCAVYAASVCYNASMEMRLGEHLSNDLFLYERSRFRSAVAGVIITSLMTMGLGMVVWPVLRDLLYSRIITLQTTATVLGIALIAMVFIWLYVIIRLIVRARIYSKGVRKRHRGLASIVVALGVAIVFAVAVPVVVFILNPIT